MDSLLYQIYSGSYDITPKQDQAQQALHAELDKVQKMLGGEFVDRLLELEGEREDWRGFQYYRAGFSAGIRLVLEAIISATG